MGLEAGLLEKKDIESDWLDLVLDLLHEDTEGTYGSFCKHVLSHVHVLSHAIGQDVWKK